MFVFDPAQTLWTDLTADTTGTPPSPRASYAFAATADTFLYVFGGNICAAAARAFV